ncbi:methyltransferase domain-containing protein [Streptomyces massasporeus]|uniref:methyltransferase domain-containing protein n=1 Tax=Streptomyces massasporeus TaxID=67324 RepID=UPI0033D1EF29
MLPDILAPGSRVLDIGSGPGRHALALAAEGHHVALVDISAACLDAAQRRFEEAGLTDRLLMVQRSDASGLNVKAGAYDAVLLFGPLYHLMDDGESRACVDHAVAALAPGGHLLAIFLTRTSIVRDLIKRGRFDEIHTLLDTGYLDHGRYKPLTAKSRADYMPPVRTHSLAEAEDLLRKAGLHITTVHALEGAAAWMRPYIDEVGADDTAFSELSAVVRATARLPELIEAGDHFLVSARRPLLPATTPWP